jgi:hypothetical protein
MSSNHPVPESRQASGDGEAGAILGFGLFTAAVPGTLLAMAGLTIVPARMGTRQPVPEVLQAEAA